MMRQYFQQSLLIEGFYPKASTDRPIRINRAWAMPNSNTFTIKPIAELLARYCIGHGADAFARDSKWADLTNDLDPTTSATSHMDAADFLRSIPDASLDYFLFDPPYSPRQVSECYRKLGKTVTMETTQARFWSRMKREIARAVKPGGHCLTFGWCSNGVGKVNGFSIVEILLVAHGGWHNDTIVTVERSVPFD